MNTASRIETTGKTNRIHLSQETANRLADAGKDHWLQKRQDNVEAKGKGELATYWLALRTGSSAAGTSSGASSNSDEQGDTEAGRMDKLPPAKESTH
jgi:hypothetical protein